LPRLAIVFWWLHWERCASYDNAAHSDDYDTVDVQTAASSEMDA
jgi:hypothetical protein